MAASLTQTNILGTLAAGNQNLSLSDTNFAQLYGALDSLNTFANYYADAGSANAYAITVPTTQTATASTGLPLQFKALNANTGASTLAVTAGTTVTTGSIVTMGGAALPNGAIAAGAIVSVIFDGAKFYLQSASALTASQITASLGTNITLGSTGLFFDGPSIAQGTTGTWFVAGQVTVQDTAGAASFSAKLWDGTTVIASVSISTYTINALGAIQLAGYLASPAGNLKISVKDTTSTSGLIAFNSSGASKDATISAFRLLGT